MCRAYTAIAERRYNFKVLSARNRTSFRFSLERSRTAARPARANRRQRGLCARLSFAFFAPTPFHSTLFLAGAPSETFAEPPRLWIMCRYRASERRVNILPRSEFLHKLHSARVGLSGRIRSLLFKWKTSNPARKRNRARARVDARLSNNLNSLGISISRPLPRLHFFIEPPRPREALDRSQGVADADKNRSLARMSAVADEWNNSNSLAINSHSDAPGQ